MQLLKQMQSVQPSLKQLNQPSMLKSSQGPSKRIRAAYATGWGIATRRLLWQAKMSQRRYSASCSKHCHSNESNKFSATPQNLHSKKLSMKIKPNHRSKSLSSKGLWVAFQTVVNTRRSKCCRAKQSMCRTSARFKCATSAWSCAAATISSTVSKLTSKIATWASQQTQTLGLRLWKLGRTN